MGVVTIININCTLNLMKRNLLFATDLNTEEVIVSESQKGSNQVLFIERIPRQKHELLYRAVLTLTEITHAPDLDVQLFKAMDKVCQMIYTKGSTNS
jgi:hypothetical protein